MADYPVLDGTGASIIPTVQSGIARNVHPGIRKGTHYYASPAGGIGATTSVATPNTLYATPFVAPGCTLNRLAVEVITAAAGSCRLGIATNVDGIPGRLMLDGGAISTGGTGMVEANIGDYVLPDDWVWLLAVFDATPTVRRLGGGDVFRLGGTGQAAGGCVLSAPLAYGAFPADVSALSYTLGLFPSVYVRRA